MRTVLRWALRILAVASVLAAAAAVAYRVLPEEYLDDLRGRTLRRMPGSDDDGGKDGDSE